MKDDLREAIVWVFMALVIGCLLAWVLVQFIAPVEAQTRPYNVYRIPRGCLYIAGNDRTGVAMVYVPDGETQPCDGALKGVK